MKKLMMGLLMGAFLLSSGMSSFGMGYHPSDVDTNVTPIEMPFTPLRGSIPFSPPPPPVKVAPHSTAPQHSIAPVSKPTVRTVIKTIAVPAVCPVVAPEPPLIVPHIAPKTTSFWERLDIDFWKVADYLALIMFGVIAFRAVLAGIRGYKAAKAAQTS